MDAAAPSPPPPRRAFVSMVLYLGALAALGPLAVDLYLPAFPRIAGDLGATVPDVQRTLATYFAGLALGQLVYGPLADRYGRKPPLYAGLALFAVASGACALAWDAPSLAWLRFAQALGGCAEMVIARAVVRDLYDDRAAARVFSSLVLVMGVAPILAPLAGGWVAGHVGWRALFWLLALAGVATLAATALFYRESLVPERRVRASAGDVARAYGRLLRDRAFVLHALTAGLGLAGLFAYVGGSPHVFQKVFGVSEGRFGLYFGPIAACIIGASQVNGWLAGRADLRKTLRAALVVTALAGAWLLASALTGAGGFWGLYAGLAVFIGSMGFVFPNTTVLAMSPHGRAAGSASAVLGSMQFGVSAVGGLIVGALQDAQRVPTAVPMAGAMGACGLGALALNLLARPAPVAPDSCAEADGALTAAEA